MRKIALLGLLLVFLSSCETWTLRQASEESLRISSSDTGQTYEISILLPPNYDPDRTYPSVYLLDGHWHYLNVAGDAQQLMEAGKIDDIILVSIAFADLRSNNLSDYGVIATLRIDDLTATKNNDDDEVGGAADAFRRFIAEDVIPAVEEAYSTNATQRTLMGHSLGGYFGIWEMLTFTDSTLFENIEAGSPALWWDDGDLMSRLDSAKAAGVSLPVDLHTTMGSLESVVWNTFFDEFEDRIEEYAFPGLTYQFERYPKGHTANAEVGFREGLLYYFGR